MATSRGWENYRHQADVLAIYQLLRHAGYSDDHIILIVEDDIAYNPSNPDRGEMRVTPEGENVHANIDVDYRLSDLDSSDFLRILRGEKSERLPMVVESGPNDNIFVFWSGHGSPGNLCWNQDIHGIAGETIADAIRQMNYGERYRKLLMMVEACYSGGVLEQCSGIPGSLFITAAAPDETSKADVFDSRLKVWMSNRFTSTFIEQIAANKRISMRDLYYRLFINTVGSHVMVYNAASYGNLYTSSMAEFTSPAVL